MHPIIVRRQIVFPKWKMARDIFESGQRTVKTKIGDDILKSFLKLLYGHEVNLTNSQLYLVWEFSSETGYEHANILQSNVESNLLALTLDQKLKVLNLSQKKVN